MVYLCAIENKHEMRSPIRFTVFC